MLLVVTRGAVALPGEDVTDLAGSAVWGLVRAAQTEHPGRLVLVDTDTGTDTAVDAAAVLAVGEPQVVVRDGIMHIARVRAEPGRRGGPDAADRRCPVAAGRVDRRHVRRPGAAGDSGRRPATRARPHPGRRARHRAPTSATS